MDTRKVCDETLSLRSRRLDGSSGRKRERAREGDTRGSEGAPSPLACLLLERPFFFFFFFFFLVPTTSKCLRKTQIFSLKLTCLVRTSVDCSDPCSHYVIFLLCCRNRALRDGFKCSDRVQGGRGGGNELPQQSVISTVLACSRRSDGGERVESYAARAKRNTRTDLSVKITNKTPIMKVLNRRTRARCRGLISGIGKYY